MTTQRHRRGGDSGIVLVLVTLTLLVLLVFSAFAIDVAGVYSERRSDQSAADAAALGALQTLLGPGTDPQVADRVIDLVQASVGSDASGYDWNSCSIPDDDSIDTPIDGKNCITTTAARDILQVRLPLQDYDSAFAGAVGVDLQHGAFAIAGLDTIGIGGVLPLPVAAGAGGGDGYVCVRTGSGGALESVPPCDKQDTGAFGNVHFDRWLEGCPKGQPKDIWAQNVAQGVDHALSLYGGGKQPWGTAIKIDEELCPGTTEQYPNAANTPSTNGVVTQTVADAFFNGLSANIPGRLALSDGSLPDNDRTTIGSVSVDNNALWEFVTPGLDSAISDVPESCEEHNFIPGDGELPPAIQTYFDSTATNRADRFRILLQRCITHYNGQVWSFIPGFTEAGACGPARNQACTGVVFGKDTQPLQEGYDIQFTPRFAYVPEADNSTPLGSKTIAFASFKPVWLQRLYIGQCAGNDCVSFEPDPDSPTSYAANTKAAGMTVFVLPRRALPGAVGSEEAPFDVGVNKTVRLLR